MHTSMSNNVVLKPHAEQPFMGPKVLDLYSGKVKILYIIPISISITCVCADVSLSNKSSITGNVPLLAPLHPATRVFLVSQYFQYHVILQYYK